ncbi:hypothetical protein Hanom_Chr08g00734541 [Helianthus anomalus]
MASALLPAGQPTWTARIRDNFLHPSSESVPAYGTVILGGAILLSSEESIGSSHGLIHHSSRAVPQQRLVQDPTDGDASTPLVVDPVTVTVEPEWKEAEKKKTEERETEKKKSAEEATGAPTRIKCPAPDADDQATLTELMAKKQKILSDKKRELDEQAALALSKKKLKVMGQTVAPSDNEVDLGVFAKKSGNLLERIYEASAQPKASSKSTRPASKGIKIVPPNIFAITLPTSPPPIPFGDSPSKSTRL